MLPAVNKRCCSDPARLCDKCAVRSFATIVRNEPPKKGDGINWAALGELLGIETDPADMVAFVGELRAKLDAILSDMDGGGTTEPRSPSKQPKAKAEPPDDEPPTSEESALAGNRGGWFTGGGAPRRPALNQGRVVGISDEEAMTINAMTPRGIDWSEPSPHRRKAKERRAQRQAASGGTESSTLHPMLQEPVKPTAEDLL
jgi:hypothetical protein